MADDVFFVTEREAAGDFVIGNIGQTLLLSCPVALLSVQGRSAFGSNQSHQQACIGKGPERLLVQFP